MHNDQSWFNLGPPSAMLLSTPQVWQKDLHLSGFTHSSVVVRKYFWWLLISRLKIILRRDMTYKMVWLTVYGTVAKRIILKTE